ncbi:cobalt-precorrin-5B (C(1))-methyltransferase CbiD [Sulfurospirillum barnesii]|uniref:Cobalt-precorrin-5B C(1)-methyltransferase n=1 Tax=Sulfurospirillum barnesii (strain ATCC 700032 / DSM 10660 / SES-3) TaxID=760154 RepID=I3XZM7_SULBS|nr:cobalt-precorrin-5B (C(1))-methyltransferase CbiD [Sulfurospirillum barnesii]AFL69401.1 cobalamin biosynthesis protein CbiD [Sulfurospirillum barnesii SES-3]
MPKVTHELKKGYTTGVHANIAFASALEYYLCTHMQARTHSTKMDNDDLDVTKGCEIVVHLSQSREDLLLNPTPHTPFCFQSSTNTLLLYAGEGVGVVTKKGLKIAPHFPAINPVPKDALQKTFERLTRPHQNLHLHCAIGIKEGETLAKQTANEKVGVLGGLSILGTTGFVKPISSTAYLESIKTEICFALANAHPTLYLTLGNSALAKASTLAPKEAVIEIGNFIHDALSFASQQGASHIVLLCGIGKMTKIAQGFKNTHNRFGNIDFQWLQREIQEALHHTIDTEATLTVKGVCEELDTKGLLEAFYALCARKAQERINAWGIRSTVEVVIVKESTW